MAFENLKKELESFGDEYIKELTIQLIQLDKVATGSLLRSLDFEIIEKVEGQFEVIIKALDYLKFIDEGRRPGKQPPLNPILSWVKTRNIRFKNKNGQGFLKNEQTAFIIRRSIGQKGIKKTDVLKKTLGNVLNLKNKILKSGMIDIEKLVSSVIQQEIK